MKYLHLGYMVTGILTTSTLHVSYMYNVKVKGHGSTSRLHGYWATCSVHVQCQGKRSWVLFRSKVMGQRSWVKGQDIGERLKVRS